MNAFRVQTIIVAVFLVRRMASLLFARGLSSTRSLARIRSYPSARIRSHGLFSSSSSSSSSSSQESTTISGASIGIASPLDENYFLSQVETTIGNVFASHDDPSSVNILDLPVQEREDFGVAINLHKRLSSLRKNNDCPRCWMQRKHCICGDCNCVVAENETNNLSKIYVVCHHKEIGLKVDTAKLILAAFPSKSELVVGGIGSEHQASMQRMLDSLEDPTRTSLVLFPDDTAKMLEEIIMQHQHDTPSDSFTPTNRTYDLIVLDGTWAQARKFHSRYFAASLSPSVQHVQLSEDSVQVLHDETSGHQLRRHAIQWRQVGTFEAVRLFLRDWAAEFPLDGQKQQWWERIESYQRIANEAALKELGPPRA